MVNALAQVHCSAAAARLWSSRAQELSVAEQAAACAACAAYGARMLRLLATALLCSDTVAAYAYTTFSSGSSIDAISIGHALSCDVI